MGVFFFCSEPPPAVPSLCHELHEESKIASEIEFETRPNVPFWVRQKDLKASLWNCWSRQYTEQDTTKTVITAWISDQLPKRNPHIVQMYFLSLLKWIQSAQTAKSFGMEPKTSWKSKPTMSYLRGLQSLLNDSSNWDSGKKKKHACGKTKGPVSSPWPLEIFTVIIRYIWQHMLHLYRIQPLRLQLYKIQWKQWQNHH